MSATLPLLAGMFILLTLGRVIGESGNPSAGMGAIDQPTLDAWSAPYRGWHYYPDPVIPPDLRIPGHEKFHSFDVPTVYQIRGEPKKWFLSFIGFNGEGYNSFVAESTDLVHWTNPRLAMGFGPTNEFDHGGCVIGAFLYESYDINAPRMLQRRDDTYWTLYGCYPRQGGYELRPGYEGVAVSDDGLTWRRARNAPILAVQDPDCGQWEKDCIYQPWLVEHEGLFYNFYNAAHGSTEQMGAATSLDLLHWKRGTNNPIVRVRPGGYDSQFCSDGKVFRDGDHWVMFYFGVGKGGAHIMCAFSRDLKHWTSHPEPLYRAGGHPQGLDSQYAHKISLVRNPENDTFYMYYCAVGKKGRGIGLLTSRKLKTRIGGEPSLFAQTNLVAWCIVPFDAKKRRSEERAQMLEKLGFSLFAYDYRAEHVPGFDAEMEALRRHQIRLLAWWFPGELNDEARLILDVMRRHNIRHAQLWVTGSGEPANSPEEQRTRIDAETRRLKPIADEAARLDCSVALYNHGGWFGEPENQLAIIAALQTSGVTNVGLVYNLHHAHEQVDRFAALLQKMKPHLLALNLNGMVRDGEKTGKKILPLGAGDLDLKLLQIISDSGWRGPLGILNHTDEDAETRLQQNLQGLRKLVSQLNHESQ